MFLIDRKDVSVEGSLVQEFTVLGSTGNVYKVRIDTSVKLLVSIQICRTHWTVFNISSNHFRNILPCDQHWNLE